MRFLTTIEIEVPDDTVMDDRQCGQCGEERTTDLGHCTIFDQHCDEDDDDAYVRYRCPACLAAEKAAKERPRMLQECPECHGACANNPCYQCPCQHGSYPGWIEAKP
jgi:hypothetical protein